MKVTRLLLVIGAVFCVLFINCDQLLNPEAANNPPDQPFSPNPYSGQMLDPGEITLYWQCSDPDGDPLTYDVAFGNSPSPQQIANKISSRSYDVGNVLPGTWYWRVVAHDSKGEEAMGPVWSFQVIQPNQPPEQPSNPYPADNAQNASIYTQLSWTCDDPEGDELQFEVHFGESTEPAEVGTLHNERTYNPGLLEPLTRYYWKIIAYQGGSEERIESPLWSFTTEGPGRPNFPTPPDGDMNISVDTDLSWECENPNGNTVEYDVYFGLNSYDLVAQGVQDNHYDPGTLEQGAIYRWKIVARYAGAGSSKTLSGKHEAPEFKANTNVVPRGKARDSEIPLKVSLKKKSVEAQKGTESVLTDIEGPDWEFTTETVDNQPPYEPSNPSPYDGETGINPDDGYLMWDGGDPEGDWTLYYTYMGTDQYNLQPYSWDRADTHVEFYNLEPNTQYFWKAEARDSHDHSTMGPIWSFWTRVTHRNFPQTPYNPSPSEAQSDVPYDQVTLTWSCDDPDPDGDKVYYDLYVSPTGSSTGYQLKASDLSDPTYTLYSLDPNTTYLWKVNADDDFDHIAYGPEWMFSTSIEQNEIVFNDANLEAAVREYFGISEGPIYDNDVEWATEFSATGRNIMDLTGLEYFTNLSSLTLSNNNISSLIPISQLTNLGFLYVDQNNISDVGALHDLTNITDLNISDNDISYIGYLENLTSLRNFYFSNNPVQMINILEDFPDLVQASMAGTNVTDLRPLYWNDNFANGAALDITGCPLDTWSKAQYLPLLERRGVWVTTDIDPTAIYFVDENFDRVVHDLVGVPYETQLYDSDVSGITEWDLSYKFILDLAGLQHLSDASWLDLSNNTSIDDLWPLSWLTSLSTLRIDSASLTDLSVFSYFEEEGPYLDTLVLSNNYLVDVSILNTQMGLEYLDISGNQVQDISSLYFAALEVLKVANNPITDLSVLSYNPMLREVDVSGISTSDIQIMTSNPYLEIVLANNIGVPDLSMFASHQYLTHLEVRYGAIEDLTPLVDNLNFGSGAYLDLTGNPLSADAINTQIPALEARGVIVDY
ncbi:MAG: leucine-rich repeat domain-containing protein [bacterium]